MITEFICDRCGKIIKLSPGEKPDIYMKLDEQRYACKGCKPIITELDQKLNIKFRKLMHEIDKELFPFANGIGGIEVRHG